MELSQNGQDLLRMYKELTDPNLRAERMEQTRVKKVREERMADLTALFPSNENRNDFAA